VLVVDVSGLVGPDLGDVDALARLGLTAHRRGWTIRLRGPCDELCALLRLVGLADVLPVEVRGEPEGGEQLRVQEAVEPGDAAL
jgi:hypothetical protein